jgi:hypothetical protein
MALIYEDKVPQSYRQEFVDKVKEIAPRVGLDPNWLMAIMHFETAGTFSPSITNSLGYVGLIQFGSSARQTLGVTKDELKSMSAVKQLDYVEKYFNLYKGKYKSYVDAYFAVFFPLAIGKPDDWIIQGGGLTAEQIYNANPAFRNVKDGKLRVWEVKKTMLEKLPSQWLNDGSFGLAVKAYKNYIAVGILSIVAGLTLYYYFYDKRSSR